MFTSSDLHPWNTLTNKETIHNGNDYEIFIFLGMQPFFAFFFFLRQKAKPGQRQWITIRCFGMLGKESF